VSDYPSVPLYRYELVRTLSSRDDRCWGESGLAEGRRRFDRALELAQQLSEEFPAVPEYAMRYAYTCYKYGDMLDKQDRHAEAEQRIRQCVELRREQTERFSELSHCRLYHAGACGKLAEMVRKHGELAEAKDLLDESIALLSGLATVPETNYRGMLAHHYYTLGLVLKDQGDDAAAAAAFKAGGELRSESPTPSGPRRHFPSPPPNWRPSSGRQPASQRDPAK
jgi:tetratricopeptide (TPR) repeat protein